MSTDDLRTYDDATKTLFTVPEAFEDRKQAVLSWVWRPEVDQERRITPGFILADIQWDNGNVEEVTAPGNCSGRITWLNRDITYENLPYPPSQSLLRLS